MSLIHEEKKIQIKETTFLDKIFTFLIIFFVVLFVLTIIYYSVFNKTNEERYLLLNKISLIHFFVLELGFSFFLLLLSGFMLLFRNGKLFTPFFILIIMWVHTSLIHFKSIRLASYLPMEVYTCQYIVSPAVLGSFILLLFLINIFIKKKLSKKQIELIKMKEIREGKESSSSFLDGDKFLDSLGLPLVALLITILFLIPQIIFNIEYFRNATQILNKLRLFYYLGCIFTLFVVLKSFFLRNIEKYKHKINIMNSDFSESNKDLILAFIFLILFIFMPYSLTRGFNVFVESCAYSKSGSELLVLPNSFIAYLIAGIILLFSYVLLSKNRRITYLFISSFLQQVSLILVFSNLYITKESVKLLESFVKIDNQSTLAIWTVVGIIILSLIPFILEWLIKLILKQSDLRDIFLNNSNHNKILNLFVFFTIFNVINVIRAIFFL